jgi:Caspase domain
LKKALVVGINGYGFPNDLPSAVRDAEAFANVLDTVYRFDHVRVLTDGDATRDGVDRGLEWLCQSANTNDRLVVFFSGHGCRFERNGVLEDALVLQDGRLLDQHHLGDRVENVPPGVLTVVIDACFSGPDETLIHPSGQVEVARAKRWIPTELDRGRSERSATPGLKAFAPFGHTKPAPPSAVVAHVRNAPPLNGSSARLATLDEPQAKAVIVLPCLADETAPVATSRTNGLSPFTHCLINAIRRLGPNRSAIEVLQATGHELRQLGLDRTPLVMEPAEPEHLGLRAFLTFQPVLFVHPASTPGKEEIAEAVRSTLINIKEGRSMQATIPGAQTFFGEDIGTIVNTVTPIVASMLQGRAYQQPYGGGLPPFGQGMQAGQGWPGAQGWWQGGGFQSPYAQGSQGFHGYPAQQGANLQPYEIAQIVSAVTPLVVSLLQSRNYQGHFGQFLPRAA